MIIFLNIFQVEGQQCVNIPVQQCSNVPVTAPVEVPQEKCYKRPRKVCQTLVSTKPKVITAQVPKEHCPHDSPVKSRPSQGAPQATSSLMNPSPSTQTISRSYDKPSNSRYEEYYQDEDRTKEVEQDKRSQWGASQQNLFQYLINKKFQ